MKDKKPLIIAAAALLIIGIIAGTYAYFSTTATVRNTFSASSYTTVVQRSLNNNTWLPGQTINNFELNVKNEGTNEIMVRAKIDESFARPTGDSRGNNVPSTTLSNGQDAILKTIDTTNWKAITTTVNGVNETWYYYTKVVGEAGAANDADVTSNLITALTFNSNVTVDQQCSYDDNSSTSTDPHTGTATCESGNNGYDGSIYTLSVTFETIQTGVTNEAWGVPASDILT